MQSNLIAKDLSVKGRAAFFIFLQSVNDLTAKAESSPAYFIAARDYVLKLAEDFPNAAPPDCETVLQNFHDELADRAGELFTASLYVSIVYEWIRHGALLSRAASPMDGPLPTARELFAEHLQSLLDMEEENSQLSSIALQSAMSRIPLRMATLKYKEYVTDAVKAMETPVGPKDARDFKCFFNPMAFLADKDWLVDITKPLDGIWLSDCTAMNEEKEEAGLEAAKDGRKKIGDRLNELCTIFDAINSARIVLRLKPEFNGEEKRLGGERLDEAIEKELKKIVFEPGGHKTPEDSEWKEIDRLFYETGLDYFTVSPFRREGYEGYADDIDGFLAELLPYLNAEGMPANRKRFLRQNLLAFLPYPYPLEKYQKYFIDTYDALDEANRRYLAEYVWDVTE